MKRDPKGVDLLLTSPFTVLMRPSAAPIASDLLRKEGRENNNHHTIRLDAHARPNRKNMIGKNYDKMTLDNKKYIVFLN